MDLDPRLRSVDGESSSSKEIPANGKFAASSSSHLGTAASNLESHPHRGAEASDSPSTVNSPQSYQPGGAGAGGFGTAASVAGGREYEHSHPHDGEQDDGADLKKSRACEACRGLKVRCDPDPNEGPCKRCKKAGRNCVVTQPTRKRQKKTDSRVSELEKKIDALTASLQARAVPVPQQQQHQHQPPSDAAGAYGSGWVTAGTRTWTGIGTSPSTQSAPTPNYGQVSQDHTSTPTYQQPPIVMAGQKRKASDRHDSMPDERQTPSNISAGLSGGFLRSNEGDIVDRGLITMEEAALLFIKYKEHMVWHLPAVVFPPGMTIMELRKTKPTLFLALMASATGENHSLQRVLQKELMQLFAEKVIMTGEKNLELIQALHVAVIWYWPPEHFEELKFYQLIHIAAVMAMDIGLGKRTAPNRAPPQFRRQPPPDSTTIECRRTWLTCFFLALNTAMALHRTNLIRWTPFMTESLEILETSPDAAPTDKYFCHLVRTHQLADEVGAQFPPDDPSAMANITDARTQYSLRVLERDLDKHKASVPNHLMQPTLRIGFNVVNLYMHEMALHSDTTSEQLRPPFNAEALKDEIFSNEPLSTAHINALSSCLTSVESIFDTFLSMDIVSIRCLPVFNFMRVAYGVVILIKMYFSASRPGSEMGKVMNKDNMRVEHYLEALLDKFRATAADDKCRPAAKFLVVLAMLRSWFFKQGKADSESDARPDVGTVSEGRPPSSVNHLQTRLQQQPQSPPSQHRPQLPPQHQQPSAQHQQHQAANTPLQLLSEVATGHDRSNNRNIFARLSGASRSVPQPFFPDNTSYNNTPSSHHPSASPNQPSMSPLSGPSSSTLAAADLDAAMAPALPPWINMSQTAPTEFGMAAPMPGSWDFEGLGMAVADSQDVYESGAKIVMNEPWFMDAFPGGVPDLNFFPF